MRTIKKLHKARDSMAGESVIKAGGIQWMTAGSGLVHAEVSSGAFKLCDELGGRDSAGGHGLSEWENGGMMARPHSSAE